MSQSADAAKNAAGQTAGTAKGEAKGVASVASSKAGDVAGTAKEQGAAAANDAMGEARDLFDQTRSQVEEQAGVVAHKLGESLRDLAEDLRDLGEGRSDGSGQAAGLARNIAGRGESMADLLTRRGPSGVVDELRSFAGGSPGTFLLGALVAGVAAGRLTRGVRDEPDTGSGTASRSAPSRPAPTLGRATPRGEDRPSDTYVTDEVLVVEAPPASGGTARPGTGTL